MTQINIEEAVLKDSGPFSVQSIIQWVNEDIKPWTDPNQINLTKSYKATSIYEGNIWSMSKSDSHSLKQQSYYDSF